MELNLPQSTETENTIIGLVFTNNDYIWPLIEVLKAEDFYGPVNVQVVRAMIHLAKDNKPIDYALVQEWVKTNEESLIETAILAAFTKDLPPIPHFDEYLTLVLNKSLERQKIKLHNAAQTALMTGQHSDEASIVNRLEEVSQISRKKSFITPREQVGEILEGIFEQSKLNSHITGLKTGFHKFDILTSGLQPMDYILVAARPSMGKTSLVLNLTENIASEDPEKVICIFSLEMSARALQTRFLASMARVPAMLLKTGFLSSAQWARLLYAKQRLDASKIFINDESGMTVLSLKAKARMLKNEQRRLDLIIVDYIQLMDSDVRTNSIEQETSSKSKGLKNLAKELNVPVVALSQLSRASESRSEHRPQLSDLRYSGSLEQDADVVAFIYRAEQYAQTEENKGIAELIISKQRNGPTGTCPLFFIDEYTRFETLHKVDTP